MKTIKRFVSEDAQEVWEKEFKTQVGDTQTIFSGAVEINERVRDLDTGFGRNERRIVWVKTTDSLEGLEEDIATVISDLKAKRLAVVRQYSEEPIWDGHEEDINPSTGDALGRWSIVKLAPFAKASELDKTYMSDELKAKLMKNPVVIKPDSEPKEDEEIILNTGAPEETAETVEETAEKSE